MKLPNLFRFRKQARYQSLLFFLIITLILSFTCAVMMGPVPISPQRVWQVALSQILPGYTADFSPAQVQIIWFIRFPRSLLAILVGAGLSVVGVTMQALVLNPLADPYILGVSSGASVGAVSVILFGVFSSFGIYAVSLGAFVGAVLSSAIVFFLALRQGRISPTRLILAGVAMSYLFSAITSFITLKSGTGEAARRVLFWLLGGLSGTKWSDLTLPLISLVLGLAYLLRRARSLNILLMGEETAITLGIDTDKFRKELFLVTSLLTGVIVAVSGAIGFVGLMIPHIVRLLVGSDHRRVLPISILVGGVFLIWSDILARILIAPEELPVGIITALFGAPFFLWMLQNRGGEK
ncbi:MAG: iron ABC transporter permease [Methylacidiphilales bacterium]|nr:iron ABC transporter permease [Candidatus Methylacidiphilales bacterium]NJR14798.1 iron ABC transporter permease [Calothrix sp. CSU_2_0]